MMRVSRARFISRNVGKSRGWLVRITTAGRAVRKFFADSTWGGVARARKEAEAFRDRVLRRVLKEKVFRTRGLSVLPARKQWAVAWVDITGAHRRKYFRHTADAERFARRTEKAVRRERLEATLKQRKLC